MGPGMPPPGGFKYEKIARPKTLREVPHFLKELLSKFFVRLLYIFKLVWETNPAILFVLLFIAAFDGVMPIVGALISKEILNELQQVIVDLSDGNTAIRFWSSNVFGLLIFFFSYKVVSRMVGLLNAAVTRIAGEKVVNHVKLKIMTKAQHLDLASFDMPEFYEKLENANREAGIRPVHILSASFSFFTALISLISYIVILSTALPIAAVCIILVSLPGAIVNFYYRNKNFQYIRRRSKDRRQMNYYADTAVNKDVAKEIRMFHLADFLIAQYKSVFDVYYKGLRKLITKEYILRVIVTLIYSITSCVFFALIALQVFENKIKIGDYSLLTGAITSISNEMGSLVNTSAEIYEGTLFIDNLISFMNEKPRIVPLLNPPRRVNLGSQHTIDFEHVSFTYPGSDHAVIKDVNLHFNPGETVVLVGLNGAGKTTLIKLMTRLYDPTEGRILLDGKDIREYEIEELYQMFGIIFQDFGKYAFSVADNIRFGDMDQEPNRERIEKAAQSANAEPFIKRLPKGYDTPLMRYFEEHGTELSIGQWQKLATARAFYSRSDVLILDEPTASLDAIAEQEIFNQFDKLRKDKTTVFVSHRLSSATVASKIVVLEYGEVIEEGTHKELMAKHGKYYELFSTQAKRYIESEAETATFGKEPK